MNEGHGTVKVSSAGSFLPRPGILLRFAVIGFLNEHGIVPEIVAGQASRTAQGSGCLRAIIRPRLFGW